MAEDVTENTEFRSDLAQLLLKHIKGPADMEKLPGIILAILATTAGTLVTCQAKKKDSVDFITRAFDSAWDFEEERVADIKKTLASLDK